MKRIMATFTGKDGSMGYKFGFRYILDITPLSKSEAQICIYPVKDYDRKAQECTYSNILTFLDNWDNIIKIIKK